MAVNHVRAGNLLNAAMASPEISWIGRAALWLAYYGLMESLAKELDRFERTISKRYEPLPERQRDPNWKPATIVE